MNKSTRELARRLGVSDTAVHKAEKAGRIQREPDGSWNLEKVRAQWNSNTDTAKQRSGRDGMKPVLTAAVGTVKETLREGDQSLGTSGTTYMQARTADMVMRAQRHKIELEQLKESLVSKEEYDAKVFKLARQLRDMIQNWPSRVAPEMAAELGVDSHLMHVTLDRYVRELLMDIVNTPLDLD
ncbi:MAG: elements of external origin [Magnetococcales bacterium]|nr:elements of external origin [Magnetococcales bacterium]